MVLNAITCPRKWLFNRQQRSNPLYNTNNNARNQPNGHNDPNLQLAISTSKPDYMVELLEATRKMTRYFKKSYKHSKTHPSGTDSQHPSTNHYNKVHLDKHKCKSCNTSDEVNEIIGQACASKTKYQNPKVLKTPMTPTIWIASLSFLQTQNAYHELIKLLRSN